MFHFNCFVIRFILPQPQASIFRFIHSIIHFILPRSVSGHFSPGGGLVLGPPALPAPRGGQQGHGGEGSADEWPSSFSWTRERSTNTRLLILHAVPALSPKKSRAPGAGEL